MMGYSHTVSAAAGWLVLVETGVVQVPDTPTLIVTTLACAGAGMLPDIDHHNGSIANSIPPISRWVARIVGAVSGGHRKGTHSILGLVAFWAIAYFSANLSYNGIPWASLLLAAFSGGLALRVLGAPGGWIGAVALGYAAYTTDSLALLPGLFRSAPPFT
ncbi:metal-dependent hydrolase [Rothia mucilaginosa]|uniref:metal-dependent hydrolase n=1 Tax=Rothia mucilaginosa TaxID=43675 RepID=UPI00204FF5AE|nr:metal-dependent hydrolase [Rothia mucilaginosa]UQF82243.1 MAG: metal-dependent hydrolase [Rothia mucilaginosa]